MVSNGIAIHPAGSGTTNGVLDHVEIENNGSDGLNVNTASTQTINVTVTDSVSANNKATGIIAIIRPSGMPVKHHGAELHNRQ